MSAWLDISNNSNKFKQSYFRNFVDVSGDIKIRNANAMHLYNIDDTTPSFSITPNEMNIYDVTNGYYDISHTKLIYIKDLTQNAQLQLDQLYHRTQYIRSDSSANEVGNIIATDTNDAVIHIKQDPTDVGNNEIYVTGSIIPKYAEIFDLGSPDLPFGDLYLKKNTIHFDQAGDGANRSGMSFNTNSGTLDISFTDTFSVAANGSAVLQYSDKVAIGHYTTRNDNDVISTFGYNRTPGANLDVSGTVIISGDVSLHTLLSVGNDVSLNSNLFVADDVSFNAKLSVGNDVSMNSNVDISGDLVIFGKLGIGTQTPLCPLHVTSATEIFQNYEAYLDSTGVNTLPGGGMTLGLSIKTQGAIHSEPGFYTSSDQRIKTNIVDVPDNLALQQVRDIPCRYYEYIDTITKGTEKTIGFIAQEVQEVIPIAVSKIKEFIPDEYRILENISWEEFDDVSDKNTYKMSSDLTDVSGVKYKFITANDASDTPIETEIIGNSDNSFTFDVSYQHVFCYGKQVDDFHSIDEAKIFSLHHSAIQEIDRQFEAEKVKTTTLEAKVTELETQLSNIMTILNNNNLS